MITLLELNPKNYPTTLEIDQNLQTLLDRINQVRTLYAVPMIVTSGLRTLEDQMKINPSAPKSKHLIGAAVDIADENGKLKIWINSHVGLIEKADLYLENFAHTPNWVHFQCIPPLSGRRIFIP